MLRFEIENRMLRDAGYIDLPYYVSRYVRDPHGPSPVLEYRVYTDIPSVHSGLIDQELDAFLNRQEY